MTTSPFGQPNPFGGTAPEQPAEPAGAAPRSLTRKPLVLAMAGAAVLVAGGAAFAVLGGGSDTEPQAGPAPAAPTTVEPEEQAPTDESAAPDAGTETVLAARNPFASQAGGASATEPVAVVASDPVPAADSGGTSASASTSGGGGGGAKVTTSGATSAEVQAVQTKLSDLEKTLARLQASSGSSGGATKAEIAAVQADIRSLSSRLEALVAAAPVNFTLRSLVGDETANAAVFGWFAEGKGEDYDPAAENTELLLGGSPTGIRYLEGYDANADGTLDYARVQVGQAVYRVYVGESIQLSKIG